MSSLLRNGRKLAIAVRKVRRHISLEYDINFPRVKDTEDIGEDENNDTQNE